MESSACAKKETSPFYVSFYVDGIARGLLTYRTSIRAAIGCENIKEAVQVACLMGNKKLTNLIDHDHTALADLIFSIANIAKTRSFTENERNEMVCMVLESFRPEDVGAIMGTLFMTKVPPTTHWFILRACCRVSWMTDELWNSILDEACSDQRDPDLDFGVTEAGLRELFNFTADIPRIPELKKTLAGAPPTEQAATDTLVPELEVCPSGKTESAPDEPDAKRTCTEEGKITTE